MATRKRRTAVRRVKLPSKFTMMPVRVNKKGEVQIGVNPERCKNGRAVRNVKRVEANATGTRRTKRTARRSPAKKTNRRRRTRR